LLSVFLILSPGAHADILHVPSEYATVDAAALVAFSGDTILVAPGGYSLRRVVLHSGVALLAEGPREETHLIMVNWEGDGLVLADDGPDTTVVAGFEMLYNSSHGAPCIDVFTSAAIVRGNLFDDAVGFGGAPTVLLHDGGIVERNQFLTGALWGIRVDGGEALIQYNTWNSECFAFNQATIAVWPPSVAAIRNNTFMGSSTFDLAEAHAEFVNNIFLWNAGFSCAPGHVPVPTITFHHNVYRRQGTDFMACETDTIWGPGNLWWEDFGWGAYLFCDTPGAPCYELTIDSRSPVVGAGENGENLGAWPVNCGPTPVGEDPGYPLPPAAAGVGFPAPNPTSGWLHLPIAVESGATIDVYDAAGRFVRRLRAGPGLTRLAWDGMDERGALAPAGAYYLRVRESGVTRTVRIVR
jgi:hypothetical protein